jgi:hypothetical protein
MLSLASPGPTWPSATPCSTAGLHGARGREPSCTRTSGRARLGRRRCSSRNMHHTTCVIQHRPSLQPSVSVFARMGAAQREECPVPVPCCTAPSLPAMLHFPVALFRGQDASLDMQCSVYHTVPGDFDVLHRDGRFGVEVKHDSCHMRAVHARKRKTAPQCGAAPPCTGLLARAYPRRYGLRGHECRLRSFRG